MHASWQSYYKHWRPVHRHTVTTRYCCLCNDKLHIIQRNTALAVTALHFYKHTRIGLTLQKPIMRCSVLCNQQLCKTPACFAKQPIQIRCIPGCGFARSGLCESAYWSTNHFGAQTTVPVSGLTIPWANALGRIFRAFLLVNKHIVIGHRRHPVIPAQQGGFNAAK